MAWFNQAQVAVTLTWVAITAGAAPVEVVLDVTVTTKGTVEWRHSSYRHAVDPTFQPVSFMVSFQFDPGSISSQQRWPYTLGSDGAFTLTEFNGKAVHSTPTPLTASLQRSMPAGGTSGRHGDVTHFKTVNMWPPQCGDALSFMESLSFGNGSSWSAADVDGPGWITEHGYWRSITIDSEGTILSPDQLTELSGDDALALLGASVGILQRDAFHEGNSLTIQQPTQGGWLTLAADRSINCRGDVVIRSVTSVPEPGTWAFSLMGLAMMAERLRRRRADQRRQAA